MQRHLPPHDINRLPPHRIKPTTRLQILINAVKRNPLSSTIHYYSTAMAIHHTLNYANITGRLKHIYGDINAQLMVENER